MASTLFDKLWRAHTVAELDHSEYLLYIDRIALHERTGTVALNSLADRKLGIRQPGHVICVMDHIIDTRTGRNDETPVPGGEVFITSTRSAAAAFGLRLFDLDDPDQGISHLVSAEQGFALPGLTVVCPDSHTCTLGALGALAFGAGTSQVEHALATSTLRLPRPDSMRVQLVGERRPGVTAKDLALYFIATYGASAAAGRAVEFAGAVVASMSVEERMTLCNMAVECSAFTAVIAPDEKVFEYCRERPLTPRDLPITSWAKLRSDANAVFAEDLIIDVTAVGPQVTWGTSPQHGTGVGGVVPALPPAAHPEHSDLARALEYIGLEEGARMSDVTIDAAFIGSCTNARLSDLRAAAGVLAGRRVAPGVQAVCVPGSKQVKRAAESEGLDEVFRSAGFEWREPGCSMCFFAGGEHFGERKRIITTTNRNFEGRQGPLSRSHLASPTTVAASAIAGRIAAADC